MAKGKHRRKSHSGILGERSEKEKGELHMKKHNVMRVASAMAVVTLLSTSLISGTLAKYVSTGSGSSSARVATWSILVGSNSDGLKSITEEGESTFDFDLFKSVLDEKDSNTEGDIKAGTNETIVAPGTKGYVDLKIQNKSEVNATYNIAFTDTTIVDSNGQKPDIQYAIADDTSTEPATWTGTVSDLDKTSVAIDMDATATYRVYWKWAYTDTDNGVADTKLGTAVTPAKPAIKATVTATQVD